MSAKRLTGDARRRQILDTAKGCFARHGFAGTTTKSIAAAAGISEGLLFKHFPTKAMLYAEILVEACETDPALHRLLGLEPSTETLVVLIRDMVRHFLSVLTGGDQEETQRFRLLISSYLDDGEFARLLFEKIGALIAPVFTASLDRAVADGDAVRISTRPLDLFWFSHHLVQMVALTRLPQAPSLPYPEDGDLERQLCDFILRGIGLSEAAIARDLDPKSSHHVQAMIAESA
jgi:AcrR family transcriptional regulator